MCVLHDLLSVLDELSALDTVMTTLRRRVYDLTTSCRACKYATSAYGRNSVSGNDRLFVNATTYTVEWRGRYRELGPSLGFDLLYCLAQHPGRLYTYDILKERVWQRQVSDDAVRALVKRLRHRLVGEGMADLAKKICGRERRYGLFLTDSAS